VLANGEGNTYQQLSNYLHHFEFVNEANQILQLMQAINQQLPLPAYVL
jgi:hypothetical protein